MRHRAWLQFNTGELARATICYPIIAFVEQGWAYSQCGYFFLSCCRVNMRLSELGLTYGALT